MDAVFGTHNACFTAATITALRTYFGRDNLSFSAHSTDSGTTSHYRSLSKAMAELNGARVWARVHYRFAATDGHRFGAAVARDVLDHTFAPR